MPRSSEAGSISIRLTSSRDRHLTEGQRPPTRRRAFVAVSSSFIPHSWPRKVSPGDLRPVAVLATRHHSIASSPSLHRVPLSASLFLSTFLGRAENTRQKERGRKMVARSARSGRACVPSHTHPKRERGTLAALPRSRFLKLRVLSCGAASANSLGLTPKAIG